MNDIEGIVICGRARGAAGDRARAAGRAHDPEHGLAPPTPPQQPKPQGALRQVGSDARMLATTGQVVGSPAMLGGTILRYEDVAR